MRELVRGDAAFVNTPARSPSRAAAPGRAWPAAAPGRGTIERAPAVHARQRTRRPSAAARRPAPLADAERSERARGAPPGGREGAGDDRARGELRSRGCRADPHASVQRRAHLDQALRVERGEVPRVEAQRELAGELGEPQPLVGGADARHLGPGAREQLLLLGLDDHRAEPGGDPGRGSALSWWNHGGVAPAVVSRASAAASQRPYSGGASCVPGGVGARGERRSEAVLRRGSGHAGDRCVRSASARSPGRRPASWPGRRRAG